MTLFYPVDSLYVLDYNRVLKSLNGLSSLQFMDKLSENFELSELPTGSETKPAAPHKFTLHIDGKWHSMNLKETSLDRSTPIS